MPGLLARSSTEVLLVANASLAVTDGSQPELLFLPGPAAMRLFPEQVNHYLYLGRHNDRAYLGVDVSGAVPDLPQMLADLQRDAALPPGARWASPRDVGALLSARDSGLAMAALAVFQWHANYGFCPRCGAPTGSGQAGWIRSCPRDGTLFYPRTDPAVIMAITDDAGRLLLGRGTQWPEHRFSTLAGFVEPGEALESAVRREVFEETTVKVGEVAYQGSQPWPFPASLMMAFTGRALTTDIQVDGVEVADARWFERGELVDAVQRGAIALPGQSSVARALLHQWLGHTLPTP